jgi:hypothetical protein
MRNGINGDRQLLPTYEAAMSYVNQLDRVVKGIRRLLAESPQVKTR